MSKIALLTEQTMFLVEKEKHAFSEINKKMNDFLKLIQEKAAQYKDADSKETLLAIEQNIKQQQEEMAANMQEDIEFLEKQLATMKEISKIEDSHRREELTKLILSEAGELLSMEDFKKQIEEQSEDAQREFFSMIDDMESAINEGKEEELLLLMEQAHDEEEQDSCCDDDECEEDCDSDMYEGCGSESCDEDDDACCGSGCGDACSSEDLSDDLVKDIERAQKLEKKGCCRDLEGCSGPCKCKGQCSSDA